MMRYYIGAILVGAFLVAVGIAGARRRAVWNPIPQDITCAQLAADGFGSNSHVRLSDFYLCDFAYVYEEKLTVWQKAWVPVVPKGGAIHLAAEKALESDGRNEVLLPGRDIKIIVLLPDARRPEDIERAGAQEVIQGTVSNAARVFDRQTKNLMEESYPGLDYNNCYLLTAGAKATSEKQNTLTTIAGILIAVVGAILSLREWKKGREDEWQSVGPARP